eukprot:SAG31_NODE_45085_length_260_cov_0.645963_1_plen_30_part_10
MTAKHHESVYFSRLVLCLFALVFFGLFLMA